MASIAFHDPRISSTSGGGETVTLQLVSFLLAAGHDVTVITTKAPRSRLFERTIRDEPLLRCVELDTMNGSVDSFDLDDCAKQVWNCDRLAPDSLRFNLAARAVYERHRFDLVVVSFIPDLALLSTQEPILLNVFGLPPDETIARIERPLLKRCGRMTFASTYTKREFSRLFGLDDNCDAGPVIHASAQLLFFDHPRTSEIEFDVCFAGRLTKRKGLYPILAALARLKRRGRPITIAVVGAGPEKEPLTTMAADLDVLDQITWLGALDPAGVAETLDRSRCFLSPSLEPEAFACVNIEAMARGSLIITTNLGGTRDYIRAEENALTCEPGSEESLAEVIVRVLDDRDLRSRLRTNGLLTARKFHPAQASRRWLSFFEEALRTLR